MKKKMIIIKIPYNNRLHISSSYSIEVVFRKYPLRFRLLTLTSPKDEKWGYGGGGVTKPNSIMTSFEFDPAISTFELEYVINYMLYENIAISVDEN